MRLIDLQGLRRQTTNVHHLIDCRPAQKVTPNRELMAESKRTRARQSARSRSRQDNFLGGWEPSRMKREEVMARKQYMEEWHSRMQEW